MKVPILLVWSLMTLSSVLSAQQKIPFHQGLKIEAIPEGNGFKFRLMNPPKLTQMAKNQPYLSYFWDFGDGYYKRGTLQEFTHTYAKAGSYQVRALIFTGNTLDLVEQPQPITVYPRTSNRIEPLPQSSSVVLVGSHYRDELRPSEDMILTIGTKNASSSGGKLYVFFNEKRHKGVKPLEFKTHSAYFGEKEGADNQNLPEIVTAKGLFNDVKVFDVSKTDPSVSNLFLTFRQVSDMTNKIVNKKVWIHAVWIVNGKAEKADLTLTVVPSHDPNDLQVDPDYLSFRRIKKQDFTYRVRFENTEKGIVKSVGVKVLKPKQVDTSRIEWLDFAPKCVECPPNTRFAEIAYPCYRRSNTADYVEMYFHNAQLAGKVKGLRDKDLMEGFVRYKLYPIQRGMKKLSLESKAVVTFDGQEKATNRANVNFTSGFWFGPKIGINYDRNTKSSSYFLGAVLSPYKAEGWHLQFEALSDFITANKNVVLRNTIRRFPEPGVYTFIPPASDSTAVNFKNIKQRTINIVPLQLTKSFGKFVDIGVGMSADVYFQTINQTDSIYIQYLYLANNTYYPSKLVESKVVRAERKETQFRVAPFGDIALGKEGFKVGVRYTYPIVKTREDYLQIYSYYKF
jgi:hypothetical protein